MGSITTTTEENNIEFNSMENLWFVCKYCRRAYQQKHQLIEHKKTRHSDLLSKASHDRKQARKKLEEEKKAATVAENESSKISDPVSNEFLATCKVKENEKLSKRGRSSSPVLANLAAAEATPKFRDEDGSKRDESDSEIEVVFDSHRPLGSPMKPLSPCTGPGEEYPPPRSNNSSASSSAKKRHSRRRSSSSSNSRSQKRARHTEIIPLDSPDYDSLTSTSEIISKICVLGKYRYCAKCYKMFHRFSSYRSHQRICHLKRCSSLSEFKSKYEVGMITSSRRSSCVYPTLVQKSVTQNEESALSTSKFPCKLCGSYFERKSDLASHLHSHMLTKSIMSLERNMDIPSKKMSYQRAILLASKCTGLGYRHYLHNKLNIHGIGAKPSKCDLCVNKRSVRYLLARARHFPHHVGNKAFKCRLCARMFQGKSEFLSHFRVDHNQKQSSKTSSAARNFSNKNELVNCKLCGKTFLSLSSLQQHLRNHSFSPVSFDM